MKEVLFILFLAIVFFAGAVLANLAAFYITERPVINVKPFNCLPCASHWLTFAVNSILGSLAYILVYDANISTMIGCFIYFSAFISGLVSFFYNKSKFKVYD